jgi:hypothetical protein
MHAHSPPEVLVLKSSKTVNNEVFAFHSGEIARQFSLRGQGLFRCVGPREFTVISGPRDNLRAVVSFWNDVNAWVRQEIVTEFEIGNRARFIEKMIEVLEELKQLHNHHVMAAIVAGLGDTSVYRLQKTWKVTRWRTFAPPRTKERAELTQCSESLTESTDTIWRIKRVLLAAKQL